MGLADDCQNSCCKQLPTPTPLAECGAGCVPSFLVVGDYFSIPELDSQINMPCPIGAWCSSSHAWRIDRILPSGWILVMEDSGLRAWINLGLIKVLVPVLIARAQ